MSTPSANVRAPPAPANVSVRMPIARRFLWLWPNMKIAKWLACQTAVASSAYLSLAASILPMVEQAALLTDWIAPTVATDTGAGRVQFTIDAFRRDHRDRPDHAFVPDDVVAQQREQRREQAAERRPFRAVHAVFRLRRRPGEIEGQRVVLLRHGQERPCRSRP